jgi:hypothetical protein
VECILVGWSLGALIGLWLGSRRGQPIGGCLVSLLLGPLGWVLILMSSDSRRRPCPACKELIVKDAVICPHCRTPISGA